MTSAPADLRPPRAAGTVLTHVLDNGLRLVIEEIPTASRIAVCFHHGVGFRQENSHQEGFAHLFEHLMFQGSARVRQGQYYEHAKAAAGFVNGTTHQDYTDFQHVISSWELERLLFFEADRLRAPRFTRATLKEQLELVQQEIHFSTSVKPYQGLPWPRTSQHLFDRHPNAHNGYGDMNQLGEITLDDCARFFNEWYTPGNTVVTAVGAVNPQHFIELAERWLGSIPARAAGCRAALGEEPMVGDRLVEYVDGRAPRPGAVLAWRVGGPEAGLSDYVARLAACGLLEAGGLATGRLQGLEARLGYFGVFDAITPEVLNVVGTTEGEASVVAEVLDEQLARFGAAAEVETVHGPMLAATERVLDRIGGDLLERARFRGRTALLFNAPDLLHEAREAVQRLQPADVARQIQALAASSRCEVRALTEAGEASRQFTPVDRVVRRVRIADGHDAAARALLRRADTTPAPATILARPSFDALPSVDEELIGHLRVSRTQAVSATLLEVRLVSRTGNLPTVDPWSLDDFIAEAQRFLQQRVTTLSASFTAEIATEGEGVVIRGTAAPEHLASWCQAVREALDQAAAAPRRPGPRTLTGLAWKAARTAALPPSLQALAVPHVQLADAVLSEDRLHLVVAGSCPDPVLHAGAEALRPAGPTPIAPLPLATQAHHVLQVPGSECLSLEVRLEPDLSGPSEAARYLSAAVLGGSPFARIYRDDLLQNINTDTGIVSRGTLAGRAAASILLSGDRATVETAEQRLGRLRRTLIEREPTEQEVRQNTQYCAHEMLNIVLSPRDTADYLSRIVLRGVRASSLADSVAQLQDLSRTQLMEAFQALFHGPAVTIRLIGEHTGKG